MGDGPRQGCQGSGRGTATGSAEGTSRSPSVTEASPAEGTSGPPRDARGQPRPHLGAGPRRPAPPAVTIPIRLEPEGRRADDGLRLVPGAQARPRTGLRRRPGRSACTAGQGAGREHTLARVPRDVPARPVFVKRFPVQRRPLAVRLRSPGY